jgi:hypothetical protein
MTYIVSLLVEWVGWEKPINGGPMVTWDRILTYQWGLSFVILYIDGPERSQGMPHATLIHFTDP